MIKTLPQVVKKSVIDYRIIAYPIPEVKTLTDFGTNIL